MKFTSFTSIRNRVIKDEQGQSRDEDGYGLVAYGDQTSQFRDELSWKWSLGDVLYFDDAVIVMSRYPDTKQDVYDMVLAIYRLVLQKNGSYHIEFFKGKKQVMEHLLREKYPFISTWTLGNVYGEFWGDLGFKGGILRRNVSRPTMGNCIHCKYTKAKFLSPEFNSLFCSNHCFQRYEAALK